MQILNNILQVNNIKKYFTLRRGFKEIFHLTDSQYVKAIDDVSFKIGKGRVFVLAGESGSGKTTLARLILRAIDPDSGSIIFDGEDITTNNRSKLKKFRTNVQMIYQDPYTSINPRMKIKDIVMEPLNIHNRQSSKQERMEKVARSLEDVRLQPVQDIAEKLPHMLSGGQRTKSSPRKSAC